MLFYIIIGLGLWIIGGIIAVDLVLDANMKYYVRYVAPFLPVSEWEVMTLEDFRVAAELGVAAGTISTITFQETLSYLKRNRKSMCSDTIQSYDLYLRSKLMADI